MPNDRGRLWRDRADAARREAEQTVDPEVRRQMFEIAAAYERLAVFYAGMAAATPSEKDEG